MLPLLAMGLRTAKAVRPPLHRQRTLALRYSQQHGSSPLPDANATPTRTLTSYAARTQEPLKATATAAAPWLLLCLRLCSQLAASPKLRRGQGARLPLGTHTRS